MVRPSLYLLCVSMYLCVCVWESNAHNYTHERAGRTRKQSTRSVARRCARERRSGAKPNQTPSVTRCWVTLRQRAHTARRLSTGTRVQRMNDNRTISAGWQAGICACHL